ncbi:MAG TPA: hypothetical protein VF217_03525 [Rhodanobacteraceae bacterium]
MAELDDLKRAGRAREVLENELFAEAFRHCLDDLRRQRLQAKHTDTDTHSKLVIAEQLLERIERFLVSEIETGEQTALEIERKRKWF